MEPPNKAASRHLFLTGQYTHISVCSVYQSCLTLCNPMDWSPPGSSVHGIFQTTILEQVTISFSGGPPYPEIESAFLMPLPSQADSLLVPSEKLHVCVLLITSHEDYKVIFSWKAWFFCGLPCVLAGHLN